MTDENERDVISPYVGREAVEKMMNGMMDTMRQSAERTGQRRMQGETEMKIRLGCEADGNTAQGEPEA